MNLQEATQKLGKIDQRHLLQDYNLLNEIQKKELLKQIELIDADFFKLQRAFLSKDHRAFELFSPFQSVFYAGNTKSIKKGRERLKQGKVGTIVVAGGQGTRLNFKGPKGIFPISVIKRKSLFQILAEKVIAASRQIDKDLEIAIMTSLQNHNEIIQYFEHHHFFGLKQGQINFFCQDSLPLLNDDKNLFLQDHGKIATGPDGNGSSLHNFVISGLCEKWKEEGIEDIIFQFIDNPLADPYDCELIGHHYTQNNCASIKCTLRENDKEKVGLIVNDEGRPKVIEYTEFPKEEWHARDDSGSFRHKLANIGIYAFKISFIEKLAWDQVIKKLPLHLARKKMNYLNEKNVECTPSEPNAWKFEKFIFDVLPYADKTSALIYPREICYAPLKNETGEYSIETVRNALQAFDYQTFYRISGITPPTRPFELSQAFHYPTPILLKNWKGKELPLNAYIEP